MTELQIRINGIDKLVARLNPELEKKIPRYITYLSNFMENATRQNLDTVIYKRKVEWRRSGNLRQSVITDRVSAYTHKVRVAKFYGKFIEEGTRAHVIRPKKAGGVLSFLAGGSWVHARQVNHPGTKPYPFFKPAVEQTRREVNPAFKKLLSL